MSHTKVHSKRRIPARDKRLPAERPVLSGGRTVVALCILLATVTIGVYSPVFSHGFVVLDDRDYVAANSHIHSLGWSTVKWAFTSYDAANWHPLTWLSHAVDYQLFALNATGHHVDNVLIHALNAVLLFLFLYWVTKRTGPSLFVAALFALHPLNVESVAWVSERKNVLSTFFFLLVLIAYAWYARKPDWRRYLLVAAAFAASLMAKPMGVTLPFVLLLLDYWPLGRMRFGGEEQSAPNVSGAHATKLSALIMEKVPLLLLTAGSSWLTLKAQHAVVQSFEEFSLQNRLQNAVISYGLYLWKMIWPSELTFYPHPTGTLPAWQWMSSAVVLIAVTAFVIVLRRRQYLPVGWFWFLGTLVPVLGLVQVGGYAMADRYAYIPLIGIFIMIAWGLAALAEARQVRPVWCLVPALCVLAALASATVHQIGYWDSDYHLNSHMLEVSESAFAHNAVAMSLLNPAAALTPQELASFDSEPARVEEARHHFERALELNRSPDKEGSLWDKAGTLNNLANLDRMEDRLDEAREHDEAALKIYRHLAQQNPEVYLPYLAVTLNNLGAVERLQNHLDEASKSYEESLQLNRELVRKNPSKYLPNIALILNEYGLVDASQNHIDAARQHYDEALAISRQLAAENPGVYLPQLAATLSNFALFNVYERRMDEAGQRFEEAVKIDRQLAEQNSSVYLPNLAMALSNLARVEHIQGRDQSAADHYKEAYNLLQVLVQKNQEYTNEMARVETSLEELEKNTHSEPAARK